MSGIPNTAKDTLLQQITSKIRFLGPITVADYMKEVLTSPAGVCFSNLNRTFRPIFFKFRSLTVIK